MPIAAAPRSARARRSITLWLRANLFCRRSPSSIVTLLLLFLLGKACIAFWQWGIAERGLVRSPATTAAPAARCAASAPAGRSIPEKYRFILFGTYPFDEQWRPALAVVIFIALFAVSSRRSFWRKELFLLWVAALVAIGCLMWGGFFGMSAMSRRTAGAVCR